MNLFRTVLGIFAVAIIGASVTSCSNDTGSKVNSANSDLDRMKDIQLQLLNEGYYIADPQMSALTIGAADPVQLDQVEALLNEFLSRGQNVMDVANRDDVKIEGDGGGRDGIAHRIEGAKELKRLLRSDEFKHRADEPTHELPIRHEPKSLKKHHHQK